MDFTLDSNFLVISRGTPGLEPFKIQMTQIYEFEARLGEVRYVNPHTAIELSAAFNEAAALIGKYISWVNYEILQAEKEYELCKATVILDKIPTEAAKLKESGIKINEAHRDAMIARDPQCSKSHDILNGLKATKEFLDIKARSFVRAYYSCNAQAEKTTPNFNTHNSFHGALTEPQDNFMGKNEKKQVVLDDDLIANYRKG